MYAVVLLSVSFPLPEAGPAPAVPVVLGVVWTQPGVVEASSSPWTGTGSYSASCTLIVGIWVSAVLIILMYLLFD